MEATMNEIRQKAREKLGEWFTEKTKENVLEVYRLFRSHGIPAKYSLIMAKGLVAVQINSFAKQMFNGPPHTADKQGRSVLLAGK